MRMNLDGGRLNEVELGKKLYYLTNKQTLTGTYTMDADTLHVQFLDPGGASRTVLLPAEADGAWFVIINTADADEDLTVKEDSNTTTIGTVARGESQTFYCNGTTWYEAHTMGVIEAATANDLSLNTVSDDKTVKINSRNYTQASGSSIGFQVKPAQTVTSTGSVIGGEISPRVNDDIDIANVIGLHVDAYLKGTTAKTISGDVRGLQVELVTDDAGTNTISGNVSAIRIRAAFSASTLTGNMSAIRIEKAETQTNSQQWDYVLELTDVNGLIWDDDFGTEPSTAAGGFKVRINGQDRWVQTYSSAPS